MRRRRRPSRAGVGAAILAALLPSPSLAQTPQGLLEVGAARLQHRDLPASHAATASGTLRFEAPRYVLASAGGIALADDGRSTGQALLTGSLLGRPGRPARWEVGGVLTGFAQGSLGTSAGAYLLARQHYAARNFGAWAGAAIGGVEDLDRWSPTRTAEIGSWLARRDARVTATAVYVDTRSEEYDRGGGVLVTDPVTYTDATLDLRWSQPRVDLDVRGGLRLISRGALTPTGRGTRPFAGIDAAIWVMPRIALIASVGRQLSDLTRGTPDTRFAALALRFTTRDRAAAPAPPRREPVVAGLRLSIASDSAGQPRLVVQAPSGAVVELAGSFTDWEAVSLVRRGAVWELDRPMPSGAHRLLIRVDGGPWVVPANLPAAADDYGGTVGIITIP